MTRRTQFKGNSRSRRRERLKAKALANGVLAREEAISSEVLHRPTLSRAQIQAKGTHETPDRIEDAKPIKFMAQDVIGSRKNTDAIWSERPLCTRMSLDISNQKLVYVFQM